MRPTDQIDDPTWQDIHDRDTEVERLRAVLVIHEHEQEGHIPHCACKQAWGDGERECADSVREWQRKVHEYAEVKGWWDRDDRTFGDLCMLFVTEIAEAYEEWRNGHEVTETYFCEEKPEGVPTELADCVIRILDYFGRIGVDLQTVLDQKHRFNLTRPYRHGGKRV